MVLQIEERKWEFVAVDSASFVQQIIGDSFAVQNNNQFPQDIEVDNFA